MATSRDSLIMPVGYATWLHGELPPCSRGTALCDLLHTALEDGGHCSGQKLCPSRTGTRVQLLLLRACSGASCRAIHCCRRGGTACSTSARAPCRSNSPWDGVRAPCS